MEEDKPFTLSTKRDEQNDVINGQLETLLQQLQQLSVPCDAKKMKADNSDGNFSVCTTLKLELYQFTQNISDFVRTISIKNTIYVAMYYIL